MARWPKALVMSEVCRSKTHDWCCLILNMAGFNELLSRLISYDTRCVLQSGDVAFSPRLGLVGNPAE